jgi:hypothetical protein
VHHLDGAAGEPERHGPDRAPPRPVHEVIHLGDHELRRLRHRRRGRRPAVWRRAGGRRGRGGGGGGVGARGGGEERQPRRTREERHGDRAGTWRRGDGARWPVGSPAELTMQVSWCGAARGSDTSATCGWEADTADMDAIRRC